MWKLPSNLDVGHMEPASTGCVNVDWKGTYTGNGLKHGLVMLGMAKNGKLLPFFREKWLSLDNGLFWDLWPNRLHWGINYLVSRACCLFFISFKKRIIWCSMWGWECPIPTLIWNSQLAAAAGLLMRDHTAGSGEWHPRVSPETCGVARCFFSLRRPRLSSYRVESEEDLSCAALACSPRVLNQPAGVTWERWNTDPYLTEPSIALRSYQPQLALSWSRFDPRPRGSSMHHSMVP